MYLCMYSSILVGIVHGNFYDESEILNAIPQPKIVLSKRCVCCAKPTNAFDPLLLSDQKIIH